MNTFTKEQLQRIYNIDCGKCDDCADCRSQYKEHLQWCPKVYADDYREAIETIETTVPVIQMILQVIENEVN